MRLLLACLGLIGVASANAATTITLNDPTMVYDYNNPAGWQRDGQIMPDANGQVYAVVGFAGTYTGTAPTNIDMRFCADAPSCTTQIATWSACSGATIGSPTGTWSCNFNVQNSWSGKTTWLHAQARDTGVPATVSAVTTNRLAAGDVIYNAGQSQMEHLWSYSAYTEDGTTTNGSCTVSSAALAVPSYGAAANGWSIIGTNIPAGDTITGVTREMITRESTLDHPQATGSGTSFTITPNCATGTTTTGQMIMAIPLLPVSSPLTLANQGGFTNSLKASDATGYSNATYGHPEGVMTIGSILPGASIQYEYAGSGISITTFLSPSGGSYQSFAVYSGGIAATSRDISLVLWAQGGTDALNGMDFATYLADLRNVEAWTQGYRPGTLLPFMITPIDKQFVGADAAYDVIRQAQMTSIRNDPMVFIAGLTLDLTYQDGYHLDALGRYRYAKRIGQAILRVKGVSNSGFGPIITGATYNGSDVTVQVQQEAGTALVGHNLGPCTGLTDFRVFDGGVQKTIASTSCTPTSVGLHMSAPLVGPVTFDYLYGAPSGVNNVYDNMPPQGDSDGLPLQPTIGKVTATPAAPLVPTAGRRNRGHAAR